MGEDGSLHGYCRCLRAALSDPGRYGRYSNGGAIESQRITGRLDFDLCSNLSVLAWRLSVRGRQCRCSQLSGRVGRVMEDWIPMK